MADTGGTLDTGESGESAESGERGASRTERSAGEPDAPDIEFEPVEPARTLPGAESAYAPVLWLVDRVATRVFGQPTTLRWTANPADALRGEVEVVTVGVPAMRMAGLRLERVVGRVERVRIQPGLVPRLKGGPVSVKATVTQESVDRWVGSANLPLRLELTADGILSSTGIGSLRVGHVLTALEVGGRWLRLRPRQVAARELPEIVTVAERRVRSNMLSPVCSMKMDHAPCWMQTLTICESRSGRARSKLTWANNSRIASAIQPRYGLV